MIRVKFPFGSQIPSCWSCGLVAAWLAGRKNYFDECNAKQVIPNPLLLLGLHGLGCGGSACLQFSQFFVWGVGRRSLQLDMPRSGEMNYFTRHIDQKAWIMAYHLKAGICRQSCVRPRWRPIDSKQFEKQLKHGCQPQKRLWDSHAFAFPEKRGSDLFLVYTTRYVFSCYGYRY